MKIKNFKVIADDLGLYPKVNDGIAELFKSGKIDGASLMANGEAFDDAINKAGDFKDKIGIHFVLIEEKSILTSQPLVKNYRRFFVKYCLGLLKMADIKEELGAQVRKLREAGINPAFINGHQHLHLLPRIIDITIEIAQKYGINYIRTVDEPTEGRKGGLHRKIQAVFLKVLSEMARKKIIKAGLQTNDFFVGFLNAGSLQKDDIYSAEELASRNKSVELGCHPGYEDEKLHDRYKNWGGYHWLNELELLKKQVRAYSNEL